MLRCIAPLSECATEVPFNCLVSLSHATSAVSSHLMYGSYDVFMATAAAESTDADSITFAAASLSW